MSASRGNRFLASATQVSGISQIVGAVAVEPTVTPIAHRSRRIPQLDALRGFLLVWMTLTHLPTSVSAYSNQVVGYVSAAEGFIFMAAVITGQIQQYGERAARRETPATGFAHL